MMQILAMSTMLIDHIGYLFFPNDLTWRIIGRIAFPLYALGIVLGYQHTRNIQKYMLRLFILALISQFPFSLAFQYFSQESFSFNVIVTLFLSLSVIYLLDRQKNIAIKICIIFLSLLVMMIVPMDYGAYGLVLVLIYRYSKSFWPIVWHFVLNYVFYLVAGWEIQMFSLISTIAIVCLPQMMGKGERVVPPWIWRSFYPAHLLILACLYAILH